MVVCSTVGISWCMWGDILSTMGNVQYHGGYHDKCGGYLEYRGGYDARRGYHEYRGECSVPWRYSNNKRFFHPWYWTPPPPTVLMIPPTVLKITPLSTHDIPFRKMWAFIRWKVRYFTQQWLDLSNIYIVYIKYRTSVEDWKFLNVFTFWFVKFWKLIVATIGVILRFKWSEGARI